MSRLIKIVYHIKFISTLNKLIKSNNKFSKIQKEFVAGNF